MPAPPHCSSHAVSAQMVRLLGRPPSKFSTAWRTQTQQSRQRNHTPTQRAVSTVRTWGRTEESLWLLMEPLRAKPPRRLWVRMGRRGRNIETAAPSPARPRRPAGPRGARRRAGIEARARAARARAMRRCAMRALDRGEAPPAAAPCMRAGDAAFARV
jgi:molybdopterin-biosynthesis enzyme MoeA-like protein